MKKAMALLLTLMLLTGLMGAALAYDDEITFQGIPWGTSNKEMIQILWDKEFMTSDIVTSGEQTLDSVISSYCDLMREESALVTEKKGKLDLKTPANTQAEYVASLDSYVFQFISTIGGYYVDRIETVFAGNGDSAKLIQVKVYLAGDPNSMDKDLTKKLTEVYGKSVSVKYKGWIGKDHKTAVLLVSSKTTGTALYYACLDAEEYLTEALADISAEKPVDSTDVGGL